MYIYNKMTLRVINIPMNIRYIKDENVNNFAYNFPAYES
jgi:hypothetical protein